MFKQLAQIFIWLPKIVCEIHQAFEQKVPTKSKARSFRISS